ncbi:MAG: LLM class F420-dependent oxidoreductase [Actinobacteria bacterium]|nr:MAG: LLM class F420-dependent oxidoreductase [Actinomycetota bacterium]
MAVDLGTIGVWTTYSRIGEENAGEAARLVEELGYGVFWLGGSPRLPSVRPLLEATENLVVATGIVNVWTYEPAQLADEYATLAHEFPERLLVGIGIGHPEAASDYSRPLSAMRAFLDGLDRAETPLPHDRRCLAALAPKMLALSAERSLGAIPYFVPVDHTRFARAQVGADPLLAPEVAFVLDDDPGRARDKAREYARLYLGLSNYTNNLLRHGFTEEDMAEGGSDRLIDAVIPHGSADEIATAVRAHLDAGANHVVLQAVGESGIPRTGWTALAAAVGA